MAQQSSLFKISRQNRCIYSLIASNSGMIINSLISGWMWPLSGSVSNKNWFIDNNLLSYTNSMSDNKNVNQISFVKDISAHIDTKVNLNLLSSEVIDYIDINSGLTFVTCLNILQSDKYFTHHANKQHTIFMQGNSHTSQDKLIQLSLNYTDSSAQIQFDTKLANLNNNAPLTLLLSQEILEVIKNQYILIATSIDYTNKENRLSIFYYNQEGTIKSESVSASLSGDITFIQSTNNLCLGDSSISGLTQENLSGLYGLYGLFVNYFAIFNKSFTALQLKAMYNSIICNKTNTLSLPLYTTTFTIETTAENQEMQINKLLTYPQNDPYNKIIIDWGDGNIDYNNFTQYSVDNDAYTSIYWKITHNYTTPGEYIINIYNNRNEEVQKFEISWNGCNLIKSISDITQQFINLGQAFQFCNNLTTLQPGINLVKKVKPNKKVNLFKIFSNTAITKIPSSLFYREVSSDNLSGQEISLNSVFYECQNLITIQDRVTVTY